MKMLQNPETTDLEKLTWPKITVFYQQFIKLAKALDIKKEREHNSYALWGISGSKCSANVFHSPHVT